MTTKRKRASRRLALSVGRGLSADLSFVEWATGREDLREIAADLGRGYYLRALTKAKPAARVRSGGHENALLRAAQMAVAGGSREEIERALEKELAIPDPGPIVDELLGPRG